MKSRKERGRGGRSEMGEVEDEEFWVFELTSASLRVAVDSCHSWAGLDCESLG